MTTCSGNTTRCTGGPLIPVRIRSDRRETMLCRGCLDVWLAMGADVVDLRPEREAARRRLGDMLP